MSRIAPPRSPPLFSDGDRHKLSHLPAFIPFEEVAPMSCKLVSLVLAVLFLVSASAFGSAIGVVRSGGPGDGLVPGGRPRRDGHRHERGHQRPAHRGHRRRGTILHSRAAAGDLSHQSRAAGVPDRGARRISCCVRAKRRGRRSRSASPPSANRSPSPASRRCCRRRAHRSDR